MAAEQAAWTYELIEEPDATFRVEVIDEDGAMLPIARQVTRGQAEKLIQRITIEAAREHKPIKAIIRDPYFMAAMVITIKRQAI